MKISVLCFALTLISNANVFGQRNGNVNRLRPQGNRALKLSTADEEGNTTRKLRTVNEDGLSKRQQRKKEIAMAEEELSVKADEVDTAVVDESESDSMSMHGAAPVPPTPKHHRGHPGKELPKDRLQSEPLPVEPKAEGKQHRKKEGKPGRGIAGSHTKGLAAKGPKVG
eukprot:CCRYP_005039-RA/>CCRYP_005039-RA protein AED:0.04 eAED:0.04 QI:374/1/1/1/1/1/2/149/168